MMSIGSKENLGSNSKSFDEIVHDFQSQFPHLGQAAIEGKMGMFFLYDKPAYVFRYRAITEGGNKGRVAIDVVCAEDIDSESPDLQYTGAIVVSEDGRNFEMMCGGENTKPVGAVSPPPLGKAERMPPSSQHEAKGTEKPAESKEGLMEYRRDIANWAGSAVAELLNRYDRVEGRTFSWVLGQSGHILGIVVALVNPVGKTPKQELTTSYYHTTMDKDPHADTLTSFQNFVKKAILANESAPAFSSAQIPFWNDKFQVVLGLQMQNGRIIEMEPVTRVFTRITAEDRERERIKHSRD